MRLRLDLKCSGPARAFGADNVSMHARAAKPPLCLEDRIAGQQPFAHQIIRHLVRRNISLTRQRRCDTGRLPQRMAWGMIRSAPKAVCVADTPRPANSALSSEIGISALSGMLYT